jgi:hypothetical protein
MSDTAVTTIAALCFADPPGLDFAAFADAFGTALAETAGTAVRRLDGYDDLAIYAVAGTRIGLGFCDAAAEPSPCAAGRGGPAAALVVAVGPDAGATADGPAGCGAGLVVRLVDLIARLIPPDSTLWIERADLFTPDVFDEVAAAIWPPAAADATASRDPDAVQAEAEASPRPAAPLVADPMPRRPVAQGAAARPDRPERAPTPAETARADAPANDLPDLPPPMLAETARIRAALYGPLGPGEAPPQLSLVQRATVYCFNGTLIALCLPVGAAMFVYSALGRENPRLAARAVALTGIGIGLVKMLGLAPLLPFI